MDIQQEQLARSLGRDHRVVHGVAGSGKTMILLHRACFFSQVKSKPTLVLCYNKSLASKLQQVLKSKNVGGHIIAQHFHGWCREQLSQHGVTVEQGGSQKSYEAEVARLIQAVENKEIPTAQYNAVLIDEAHDFEAAWLKLAVKMLDPTYNSLLVLYDDAQSIYGRDKTRNFSFKSVGINAQGRTTILRLNYRNTKEILTFAAEFAHDLLKSEDADEDGIPILSPTSVGRSGAWPKLVQRTDIDDEAHYISECFKEASRTGIPWSDMAVIYRASPLNSEIAKVLQRRGIPCADKNVNDQSENSVKFMTMHSSKGLEFPIVAIPGIDRMPFKDNDPVEEARLLYVAMTRTTQTLLLTHSNRSAFSDRLEEVQKKLRLNI